MISELNVDFSLFNSTNWRYDYGAMMHVCNDKTKFTAYEDVPNGSVLIMGNHDTAMVHGKEIVDS